MENESNRIESNRISNELLLLRITTYYVVLLLFFIIIRSSYSTIGPARVEREQIWHSAGFQ